MAYGSGSSALPLSEERVRERCNACLRHHFLTFEIEYRSIEVPGTAPCMLASACYEEGSEGRGRPHAPRSFEAVGELVPPRPINGRTRTVARAAERARIKQGRECRGRTHKMAGALYIGIDVSKDSLEVAFGCHS